jgi:hypothetical protein
MNVRNKLVLVPCMHFKPSMWVRLGAHPIVEHLQLQGASLGYASALFTNITLGWKGLPRTNTLAYYEHL